MWKQLLGTASAVTATAVVGGLASQDATSDWYRRLDKPAFQPPPEAFPVAWTLLYADIALSSAVVLHRARHRPSASDRGYGAALAVNLVLNASWSWVFFRAHRLGPAVAVAGALAVSSADLARRAARTSPAAGAALVPDPAWCAFAAVLSAAIWRRNRS
jgi:benzodiazapine receptor